MRARKAGLDIDYTGLDLSEENVRTAASLSLDVRQADVTKRLPVGDAEYDCIFCLELLEHLTSPLALLEEMRRVLKNDGRAVISVPSPYSWVEVYRELFHRHDPEGHLNAFTTPVMQNLAALAGFRIERTLGTSIRIPRTLRLISTNSILARSRIYRIRATDEVVFAGRRLGEVS
jgi:SAM-dependent methyltransferase